MPIPVSNKLCQWLHTKGLEGYLRVANIELHPRVVRIPVSPISPRNREGFDGMDPLRPEVLRSYFGEYLPSTKAYKI